jgi:hypothetical protein
MTTPTKNARNRFVQTTTLYSKEDVVDCHPQDTLARNPQLSRVGPPGAPASDLPPVLHSRVAQA